MARSKRPQQRRRMQIRQRQKRRKKNKRLATRGLGEDTDSFQKPTPVRYYGLPEATSDDNYCPYCMRAKVGETAKVMTTDAGEQELCLCPKCKKYFRPKKREEVTVYYDLPRAKNSDNDCPHCGNWSGNSIEYKKTDMGEKRLACCGRCKKFYRPYFA